MNVYYIEKQNANCCTGKKNEVTKSVMLFKARLLPIPFLLNVSETTGKVPKNT